MTANFNVKGDKRKELATLIGTYLNSKVKYSGVPKCSYIIGKVEVDKNGTVLGDVTNELISHLESCGFKNSDQVENNSKSKVAAPKKSNDMAMPSESTDICYEVSIPKPDDNALNNIKALISGKEKLIKDAFGIDDLTFSTEDDKLTFDWLPPNATQEEIHALMVFVSKLCELAKNQKRVNLKEKEVPNEKYAFRCFLIRLGMNGPEYKKDRAILLSRLEGSSSFKEGKQNE